MKLELLVEPYSLLRPLLFLILSTGAPHVSTTRQATEATLLQVSDPNITVKSTPYLFCAVDPQGVIVVPDSPAFKNRVIQEVYLNIVDHFNQTATTTEGVMDVTASPLVWRM